METIKVRASLKPATIADIFHGRYTFSNKLLFVKCPITGNFIGSYVIPELEYRQFPYHSYKELDYIKSRNDYHKKELSNGLASQIFYALSEVHNEYYSQIKLKLRTADFFDLFTSESSTKPNVVYYVKVSSTEVTGPHTLPAFTDINHVKNTMLQGKLFVPSKDQSFEPFITAQAS